MILNVDDHEAGRYAKSRWLKQAGYEVTEAGTGLHALDLVRALRPSLIMLDVNLPDISGLEVCRRLRADSELSLTPILQISASAITANDRADGLDNGADAYLIEPVDSKVLLATIRALLRMRKAETDLEEANKALKLANESLTRTNEDLWSFAHVASHDLKEPLRNISCFAALLEKKYRGHLDSDGEGMLANIQKGASRMGVLIEGLLAYAQAGQVSEEERDDVDLNKIIAGVLENLQQSTSELNATVTCDQLPTVRGNEVSLSQLFQNLIHNALKYHKPGERPRVNVMAKTKVRGMVEIAVRDNGIGIPLRYQKLIFEPFQRLHGSEVSGAGIGLATCKRIVERHGGRIWVENSEEDQGTSFCFSLESK